MGVTLTDAVIHTLEEQAHSANQAIDRDKIDAVSAKMRALTVLDPRTPDEILGYDDFGIPR